MVKHTQTIRRLPTNYFSVFDHFVGLALKGLIINFSSLQRVTVKKYFEETDPPMVSQVYMFYVFYVHDYTHDIDKKVSTCC